MPLALLLAGALLLQLGGAGATNATLQMLPLTGRARCLDGTAAGVYIRETQPGADWIISIDGGGWCYNETNCYDRSLMDLGSSKNWPSSRSGADVTADDCTQNPTFCNFNYAAIPYCDGMSQLGSRDDPIIFANTTFSTKLWARGLDNLQETLALLLSMTSLKSAKQVVVTGCSAGGLSTYLHLDRIAGVLSPSTCVAGIGDAGFFVDVPTVANEYWFREILEYYYPMHNATAGSRPECLADRPKELAWQCSTGPVAVSYLRHPAFLVQVCSLSSLSSSLILSAFLNSNKR